MKLYSAALELGILKTICTGSKAGAYLLGNVNSSMFHTTAGSRAMNRIEKSLQSSSEIPTWSMLVEDPVIPEDDRIILSDHKKRAYRMETAKQAVEKLKTYAGIRKYAWLAKEIVDTLDHDSIDMETLSDIVSDTVTQVRLGTESSKMWRFGSGHNTNQIIRNLLEGDGIESIPTTFETWDRINGGIPVTAVMLVAADTGGGKSILAATFCKNLAEYGFRPCILPLEMSKEEMTARLISSICKIPVNKVLQGKKGLAEGEKNLIKKKFGAWLRKCKKQGGSYEIFDPGDSTPTMIQALAAIKPYKPDIMIIDYVALLDEVDGDNDWRKLSEAVRAAKRFAKANSIPVIVLAQLSSKEYELRYSIRMKDDADIAWFWIADNNSRETGIINIKQAKARNMNPFPFQLFVEWEYTYMRDLTDDDKKLDDSPSETDDDTEFDDITNPVKDLDMD